MIPDMKGIIPYEFVSTEVGRDSLYQALRHLQ
jgi:hypothetical protein